MCIDNYKKIFKLVFSDWEKTQTLEDKCILIMM